MMPWLLLLIPGGPTPLEVLVGNVTCASCAVSIRSVLKRAHIRLVDQELVMPYARVRIQPENPEDLPGAFQTLEKIGYPAFVVIPDSASLEATELQQVVVDGDTLRVLPARAWLALQEQAQKEVAP